MRLDSISTDLKLVEAITPQHVGAITGDYISCKTFQRVFVIVMCGYVAATDSLLTLYEAKNVAGLDAAATTKLPRIFVNLDTATSDTLAEVTAANTYNLNLNPETTNHMVVFEWDCQKFSAGFDCLAVGIGAGGATNFVAALYVGVPRYSGAEDVTAITN